MWILTRVGGALSFCCTIFFSSHHWCRLFLLGVQSVYIVSFKMSVLFLGSLLELLVPFLICVCLLCSLVAFFDCQGLLVVI